MDSKGWLGWSNAKDKLLKLKLQRMLMLSLIWKWINNGSQFSNAQMHVHHLTGEQLISSTVWKYRGRHRHYEVTVLPLSASLFDFVHLICLFNNGFLIKKKKRNLVLQELQREETVFTLPQHTCGNNQNRSFLVPNQQRRTENTNNYAKLMHGVR